MIDKVKLALNQKYDSSLFEKNGFQFKISSRTKSKYFFKTIKNVSVVYFTEKGIFLICGRIIYLYDDKIGKVKNFDDIMIKEKVSFDYILNTIEKNLIKLFFPNQEPRPSIHIDEFNLNYIEYCINIKVKDQPQVEAYIKMMNIIFIDKDDPRYINFVLKTKKGLHTSSYIKSNRKYNLNSQTGTTINFYNKYNQLTNQKTAHWKEENKLIHYESIEESIGILRLEVKYGSQILYQFRNKAKLSMQFKDYKDINFAYKLISDKYNRFFYKGNFYSYMETKNIIKDSHMTDTQKKNLTNKYADYAKKLAQGLASSKRVDHSFSDYYKRKVKALGINPVPIPTRFNISRLESPVKLLDKKRNCLSKRWTKLNKYLDKTFFQ